MGRNMTVKNFDMLSITELCRDVHGDDGDRGWMGCNMLIWQHSKPPATVVIHVECNFRNRQTGCNIFLV